MRLNHFMIVTVLVISAAHSLSAQSFPPEMLWNRLYNVYTESRWVGYSFDLMPLSDGSFVMTASVPPHPRIRTGIWLCRVEPDGAINWERNIVPEDSNGFRGGGEGRKIVVSNNGDIALIGHASNGQTTDIVFILADTTGNVLVEKLYGENEPLTLATDICQTEDGFALLAGEWVGQLNLEAVYTVLIRIDENGEEVWRKYYGQQYDLYIPSGFIPLVDGGFLICGQHIYNPPDYLQSEAFIIRSDSVGEVVWQRTYGGDDIIISRLGVLQTGEDEFAVIGGDPDVNIDDEWWDWRITWIDSQGEILYSGERFSVPREADVKRFIRTADGGYAFIGASFWMLRTDEWGSELWQHTYGDTVGWGRGYAICSLPDSGYAIGGMWHYDEGDSGIFGGGGTLLMRLGPEQYPPDVVREPDAAARSFILLPAYPNPFNSAVRIEFSLPAEGLVTMTIADITGREVLSVKRAMAAGKHTAAWNAEGHPAGLYLMNVSANGHSRTLKALLVK